MSTEQEFQNHDSHLYCPHFQNVDEHTLRQLFSKVAAIRSENKELFDFTHRPIEVFRSPQGTQTDRETVGEQTVYREFSDDRIGNFAVVIEGEVGTGKSELCAYLAHRLKDEADRPILHVDKDDDLMTLLSQRIPEFHEEQFGEELPGASNFRQLRKDLNQNASVVANNATSGAILNLSAKGYDLDASGKEDQIREYIQDQLSLLVEKGEYAKEIKFVTAQAYRQNDFLQVIEDDIDVEEAVSAFNEELWREVQNRYQTASLDDVLERVGEKFTDTRPVIIFEDFAITAMEAKRLRNYMERDKGSDTWDFIVAGTRDSTSVLHTRTAEDRFEFYRTNRQNSNSVLFLDEDTAVDFIRPYLGYFKSFDGSVRYDRSSEGFTLEVEPAPDGSICAECGFCDESFRDLFPFNEPFLRRLYSGLPEDLQSPREYVMAVFEVLRDYYEGYIDAPSDADRLTRLTNSVDPATEIYEETESLARLARWYGSPMGNGISIDKRFVEVFGLDAEVNEHDEVDRSNGNVIVPTSIDTRGTQPRDDIGDKDDEDEDKPVEPQRTKTERLIEEHRPNVQPWQKNPGSFPEITRYMRTGLRDAIDRLTNGFKLFDGMELSYNLSSQKDPFIFESLGRAPDDDQIVINALEFRISDLRNLLRFGIYREEAASKADYDDLFTGLGTQLTGYARRWRNTVIDENLSSDNRFFKKSANYGLEDFVLAGYAYVVMLDSPFMELTAEALNKRFSQSSPYKLDSDLRAELQAELSMDDFDAIVDFLASGKSYKKLSRGEQFEEMVGAFFGANADTLDIAAVRSWLQRNSPYEVLDGLGRAQIQRISPRVRFDTKSKIPETANDTYDLHNALEELEDEYRSAEVDVISQELSAVSLPEVEKAVETLRTYDTADTEMIESLSKFVSIDQTNIDQAVEAAELAATLTKGSHDARIQSTLISMKLASTNVYQRYTDVTIVGGGTTTDFAERFLSVGEHYVE